MTAERMETALHLGPIIGGHTLTLSAPHRPAESRSRIVVGRRRLRQTLLAICEASDARPTNVQEELPRTIMLPKTIIRIH